MERTKEPILLAEAPGIPGLCFRGFRGPGDYPDISSLINRCKQADQVEQVQTVEDVAWFFAHLVNCDPYQDTIFAEIDGQLIGYCRVSWRSDNENRWLYEHRGVLLPEWRRQGIGRAMLHMCQERLLVIAAGHPAGSDRRFEAWSADTEPGTLALLQHEGYTPARYALDMVRPDLENIPNLTLPAGLQVRPVQMEHLEAIVAASAEAFRDHWSYSEELEPTVEQLTSDRYFDPSLWRVAWAGDEVAGMVLSFIDPVENERYGRLRGYTENICVRRPWRKQGLASALIALSLQALKGRGMQQAALGVDAQNLSGAVGLYEKMGYRRVKLFTIYHKPFSIEA